MIKLSKNELISNMKKIKTDKNYSYTISSQRVKKLKNDKINVKEFDEYLKTKSSLDFNFCI